MRCGRVPQRKRKRVAQGDTKEQKARRVRCAREARRAANRRRYRTIVLALWRAGGIPQEVARIVYFMQTETSVRSMQMWQEGVVEMTRFMPSIGDGAKKVQTFRHDAKILARKFNPVCWGGGLISDKRYADGRKDGVSTWYNPKTGRPYLRTMFRGGRANGPRVLYSIVYGTVIEESEWKDGHLHGRQIMWDFTPGRFVEYHEWVDGVEVTPPPERIAPYIQEMAKREGGRWKQRYVRKLREDIHRKHLPGTAFDLIREPPAVVRSGFTEIPLSGQMSHVPGAISANEPTLPILPDDGLSQHVSSWARNATGRGPFYGGGRAQDANLGAERL